MENAIRLIKQHEQNLQTNEYQTIKSIFYYNNSFMLFL
jgi:hypothetical protein